METTRGSAASTRSIQSCTDAEDRPACCRRGSHDGYRGARESVRVEYESVGSCRKVGGCESEQGERPPIQQHRLEPLRAERVPGSVVHVPESTAIYRATW